MEFVRERLEQFAWLCLERYRIKLQRDAGLPAPWTKDEVLATFHFCNVHRRDDKTSRVIYDLIRAQPSKERMLQAALLARVTNKATTIPGAWEVRLREPRKLAQYLRDNGINTNAYRFNTPHGLNSHDGVAEWALTDTGSLWWNLEAEPSMREAAMLMRDRTTLGPFLIYQVLLDLFDCGFWGEGFDDAWCSVGPGAYRGVAYLRGQEIGFDWQTKEYRVDGRGRQDDDAILPPLLALTEAMQEFWPAEWPAFTLHETEFMLCEYDKYIRKSGAGSRSGRKYRAQTNYDIFGQAEGA